MRIMKKANENVSIFRDMPHPYIPDKDWPPQVHKRVADELFKCICTDAPAEWNVLLRDKKGKAVLWSCSVDTDFRGDPCRKTFIIADRKSPPDDKQLWQLCRECTSSASDIDSLIADGWNELLGMEYCVLKKQKTPRLFAVYAYNEREKHDMKRVYAPEYGSEIDLSSLKKYFKNI